MSNISQALNQLLADYQVYYQRTRNYHWNVSGPMFFLLHEKFEELYTESAEHVDTLAERILAIGGYPVSTLKDQLALARLQEDSGTPDAKEMVSNIIADIEILNGDLRKVSAMAGEADDLTTTQLLDGIVEGQEKTLWMLRAFLK